MLVYLNNNKQCGGDTKMEIRKIEGEVEKWSEIKGGFKSDGKTSYAKIGLKLKNNQEWFAFFGENKSDLEELTSKTPVGTVLEFIQTKKGEYWNFKAGSMKILKQSEIKDQQQPKEEQVMMNKEDYWSAKEQRDIANHIRISRHGALNTAIELAKVKGIKPELDDLKVIADEILIYVNGKSTE
jgi:hypothetical protein